MNIFNEEIRKLYEANDLEGFDPVPGKGQGGVGGWKDVGMYRPQGMGTTATDPDAPGLPAINHATYKFLVEESYGVEETEAELGTSKKPLLVLGRPGVGKSFVVRDVLEDMASKYPKAGNPEEMREPVVFNQLDVDKQQAVLNTPGDYFILIDVRTSQLESVDFIGIPKFNTETGQIEANQRKDVKSLYDQGFTPDEIQAVLSKNTQEYLRTAKYKWAYLSTHPDSRGYLFFDEINQGTPDVINAMYAVVLDRVIFDKKISDGVAIVAAGNLQEHDPASQNRPMPKALIRRFQQGVASLVIDPDDWLSWAISKNIHPTIIAFVSSNKAQNFYHRFDADSQNNRFADPDSITNLSKFLYNAERRFFSQDVDARNYADLVREYDRIARAIVGSQWAANFVKFVTELKSDKFISPRKLGAGQRWKNINTAQTLTMMLVTTDPQLKKPQSQALASAILNWRDKTEADDRQTANNVIGAHQIEGLTNELVIFKESLKTFSKSDKRLSDEQISQAVEQAVGGEYQSEFTTYANSDETTNLLAVNHASYLKTLEHAWDTKESLLVYGDPGIGKSWAVKKFAQQKAEELDLPFADVSSMPKDELSKVASNSNGYFLFMDVRVAQMTTADFIGIPNVFDAEKEYLETKPYLWVWLATRPNVVGILFFDEMNQASKQVLKAMYSVVNADDKFIFDRKISKDILVIGAGNLKSQENAAAVKTQLPIALTRRFKAGTVVLELDPEEWIDWALNQTGTPNEIHPILLSFIMSRPHPKAYIFYKEGDYDYSQDVTPDTLRALSQNIRQSEQKMKQALQSGSIDENQAKQMFTKDVQTHVRANTPPNYANELLDFLYKIVNINWDQIVANKEMFRDPQALRRQGEEGKSMLATIFAWLPYKIEVLKTIIARDPEMQSPITRQRVKEIIDLMGIYHNNYRSAFFSFMKRLIGDTAIKDFMIKYVANNPHLDAETKNKAKEIFISTATRTQQALGGK